MIDRARFLEIAEEAFANPRTAPYDVHRLHSRLMAFPFRTADGAIPAVVVQFAVENRHDARARRVITLARSALGFSVWCGDRLTEGRLDEEFDVDELIDSAVNQVPEYNAEAALDDMHAVEGAYPFYAPCHFWKAWHSHQGVCKHVAAALQWLEAEHDNGLEGTLNLLDESYEELMNPGSQLTLELTLAAGPSEKQQARGDLVALVAGVAAPVGGLTAAQYKQLQDLLEVIAS